MPAHGPNLPLAVYEHRLPGRMRLRVRARQGDVGFFRWVAERLSENGEIRNVEVNATTASILILYGGDGMAVLEDARQRGLFNTALEPDGLTSPRAIQSSAVIATPANRTPQLLELTAMGLAGAGVLQLVRGRVLGSASENLWNAYGIYALTRQTPISAVLALFGLLQVMRGEILGSAVSLFLYAFSARRMAQDSITRDTI